jgi:hypothetical protein
VVESQAVGFESNNGPEDWLGAGVLDLAFNGRVLYWRGPAPYYFVAVPDGPSAAIRAVAPVVTYGWGVIPVRVALGESVWETSLFPKDGRYLIPIRKAVRLAEELSAGDMVVVRLDVGP